MKKLLSLLAILAFLCIAQYLQAQNFKTDSIYQSGKSGWEVPADIAFDADGGYYVTGSFAGEITIGNQLLKSAGKRDIFLAKYNKENIIQWAKNYGGTGDDNAFSLLFSGNKLYLAGSFKKHIGFNNGAIVKEGTGLTDVFFAQINTDGTIAWTKSITSPAAAQKAFLQADNFGNIWVAGSFTKPVLAEGGSLINSSDKKGVYYAKYANTGTFIQIGYYTGTEEIELNDFIISPGGQFYFAGSFADKMDMIGNTLISTGETDGFIAKLDTDASFKWLKNIGGVYDDQIKSMALDAEGNIYAAGEFRHEITIQETYTAQQNTDAFIVKFNSEGTMAWSRQLGGDSYNTATNIEMANNGKFFLSGCFRGKIQDSPELKSAGNTKNAYVAKFNTNGNRDWIMGTNSVSENNL